MASRIRQDFLCRLPFLFLRALILSLHPVQAEVSFGCHYVVVDELHDYIRPR